MGMSVQIVVQVAINVIQTLFASQVDVKPAIHSVRDHALLIVFLSVILAHFQTNVMLLDVKLATGSFQQTTHVINVLLIVKLVVLQANVMLLDVRLAMDMIQQQKNVAPVLQIVLLAQLQENVLFVNLVMG